MQAAKSRNWTAVAVAALCVVATAWPAAAAPWPPADVASDPASPLLAPVDVELELAPPVPAERAEITLALQPPHSWDGLLDLGIPSGESPSLSETRVWGFFLGSTDCVGLKRLQTSDSTGDASFFARSLRHGVYFARNNPVNGIDPDGLRLVVVVGFQTDKLSQKQQTQVSLGIRERFSNAGVDNVQVMVPGGSTSPKKTTRNDVVRVNIVDGPLKGDRKVHGVTPNKGDSSTVTTETAPAGGEGLVNFLINVGAHEAGHGTRALPQYDGDGFPLGSILNPWGSRTRNCHGAGSVWSDTGIGSERVFRRGC